MKVSAIITLKKDVLDPQGKVIHQTLDGMGFKDINWVLPERISLPIINIAAFTFVFFVILYI